MRRVTSMLVAALILSSCASAPDFVPTTATISYKSGHNDEFDSSTGMFRREYCRSSDQYVDAVLSPNDLAKLGALAESLGFFEWEKELEWVEDKSMYSTEGLPDEDRLERVCVVAPCATSHIEIRWGGKYNRVEWSDCRCGTLRHGKEAERLMREIETKVLSLPSTRKLPASDCLYY